LNLSSELATLDRAGIERAMASVVDAYGPWTAHGIELREGLFTRAEDLYIPPLLASLIEILRPLFTKPIAQMRILDLGCLEGGFAIELGRRGATVVGIEAREANIAKALFARDALGMENVTFAQDDVRNLCGEKYGSFDLVLCWGLLYHLDPQSVFPFLEQIGLVCDGMTVVDTHISLTSEFEVQHKGKSYSGSLYHETGSNEKERLSDPWGSIGNDTSFWFTREALCEYLGTVGFPTIYQLCSQPFLRANRVTLIGRK
jgi:2-polyprenyl-3-methyl-5-hydroxy-6-metoxy-1,4-benzoquinol methylase